MDASRDKATVTEWLAVIGALCGAFMATLDAGIASATMPYVQAALGARLDESSWISTAYLVAEIIAIPMTAYLANIFSPRRYLLVSCLLFVCCSIACGMARSYPEMITARFVQGLIGGTLIPMASFLVGTLLPPKQRVLGFLIFSFATSLAPYFGAVLGGWIATHYFWTYCFYMQVVPGLLLLTLVYFFLHPTGMKLQLLRELDWLGIATMSLGLGALTYVLREGNHLNWFEAPHIRWLTGFSAVMIALFVWIELRAAKPLVDLRVLAGRNFFLSNVANVLLRIAIYGNFFLLPLYFMRVHRYDANQIGGLFFAFAMVQLASFPFILYCVRKFDNRWVVAVGFLVFIISGVENSSISHDSVVDQFYWSQLVRAVGHPMALAPITAIALAGVGLHQMGSASAIFNMLRQIGASIASASLAFLVGDRYRLHFARIGESMQTTDPAVQGYLDRVGESYASRGFEGEQAALLKLTKSVNREALVMAYADAFYVLAILMGLAIVAIAFTNPKRAHVFQDKPKHQ